MIAYIIPSGTQPMREVEIETAQDGFGDYFYKFEINGVEYSENDFISRDTALSYAKSHAREILARK